MSEKKTEAPYSYAEPYVPSLKTWVLVGLLLSVYFFLSISYAKPVRYVFFALPLLAFAVFLITEIRYWLLLLPVVVTFGSISVDLGPFYLSPATVAVLVASAIYFAVKAGSFEKFPVVPVPVKIVGVAYLFQLASIFNTFYHHDSLPSNVIREGNKLFLSALILPLIYDWYGRGEWLSRLLKIITILLIIMSFYGIYQYTSGNLDTLGELASGFDLAGRVYSTISGGPNSYSGVLELLVPTVLAAMFYFKERVWKIAAFLAVILGVLNVLYTFSRGGFLTVTGACLVYLIYRYRTKLWIPISAALLFIGFIAGNSDEFTRQLTVFNDPKSLALDTSMLHRYTSYSGFIDMIAADPFGGTGWGSREYFHGRTSLYGFWEVRHEDSIDKIARFGGLNSLILEMPLKGGVLSALSLLLLITALFTAGGKLIRSAADPGTGMGFLCGLAGFGMHQFFDNLIPWPQTGAFFWIIFGLLISMAYPCCAKEPDSL